MNFSYSPFQIGAPAAACTDADLGFSRTGYRSSCITLEIWGGENNVLLFAEGAASRGSEAPRGQAAERGKVGFRVRDTRIAHIDVLVIYEVGENNCLKARVCSCGSEWGWWRRVVWPPGTTQIMARSLRIGIGRRKLWISPPLHLSPKWHLRARPLHVHDPPPQSGAALSMGDTYAGGCPTALQRRPLARYRDARDHSDPSRRFGRNPGTETETDGPISARDEPVRFSSNAGRRSRSVGKSCKRGSIPVPTFPSPRRLSRKGRRKKRKKLPRNERLQIWGK